MINIIPLQGYYSEVLRSPAQAKDVVRLEKNASQWTLGSNHSASEAHSIHWEGMVLPCGSTGKGDRRHDL